MGSILGGSAPPVQHQQNIGRRDPNASSYQPQQQSQSQANQNNRAAQQNAGRSSGNIIGWN